MNGKALLACVALLLATGSVVSLDAKGPTVKLTVTGPMLSRPLTVMDAAVLASSGVFEGAFLGQPAPEPAPTLPRYRVFFHVELPPWMKAGVHVKYAVIYAVNPKTGEGFVYLPGRGEEGYRLNVETMLRDGQDGAWHRASSAWASALNRHLAGHP